MEINYLPQNIEAEESILGGILYDPKAFEKIDGILCIEAFYAIAHQKIYKAALDLYRAGEVVDLMTVTARLRDTKKLEEIGGISRLAQLMERTVAIVNIDRHAILVMDKYCRRRLIQAGREIGAIATDGVKPLDEVLSTCEQKISEIATSQGTRSTTEENAAIANSAFEQLDDASPIYPTGFYDLDNLMVGFEPGTLTLLAGRPSMGKTAVGLAFTLSLLLEHNLPVAFFSLEMTKKQLEYRIWSSLSVNPKFNQLGINALDGDRIRKHRAKIKQLSRPELDSIAKIVDIASDLPLYINDDRGITVPQITSECRQIQAEVGQIGLVVIDYLQMMSGDSAENRSYELGDVARGIYKMAGELNVPVLALSQINRGVESRADKRPSMSDLSQSGVLEMVADNVILAYREEYYNPKSPGVIGILELILGKARHGQTGSVELFFDKTYGQLRNFSRGTSQRY